MLERTWGLVSSDHNSYRTAGRGQGWGHSSLLCPSPSSVPLFLPPPLPFCNIFPPVPFIQLQHNTTIGKDGKTGLPYTPRCCFPHLLGIGCRDGGKEKARY